MNQREREMLAEAAIPLEVVCEQLLAKPYTEMTEDLQKQLLLSRNVIRGLLFDNAPAN